VILDTGIHFRVQSVLREGSEKSGLSSGHISLPRLTSTQSKPEPLGNVANLAQATVHGLIGASFEALDLLNIGLILCGESGQLQFTNQTMRSFSRRTDRTRPAFRVGEPRGQCRRRNIASPPVQARINCIGSPCERRHSKRWEYE
jgi:hypothetical protein